MKQVDSIKVQELKNMAGQMYGMMVKAVVDIEKETLVVDMEMHVDGEQFLLESSSRQNDLWGISLYPDNFGEEGFIEFDSMINIRPRQRNMSRDVESEPIRKKIQQIVTDKVNS